MSNKIYSFKDCGGALELLELPRILPENNITFMEMCEVIAYSRILTRRSGGAVMPIDIFESSPTGELFHLWNWYAHAVFVIGWRDDEIILDTKTRLAQVGLWP